jgi:serine kinase of HPr protein (carbohydrate metabolism regulator)
VTLVHGTCVAIEGIGVLIRGGSGEGKSDLALRLIDGGARLVADDQVACEAAGGKLMAAAPPSLRGRLEVRGLGIVDIAAAPTLALGLVVELAAAATIPRLPERAFWEHAGIRVPLVRVAAFEASAAAKVRLAARTLTCSTIAPP